MRGRGRHLFVCVLSALALAAPGGAAWAGGGARHLYTGGAGEMFYYDPGSVMPLSGKTVGVVVTEAESDGSRTLTRAEVDCANRIMRGLEVTRERPNRAPEVSSVPEDWRAMESDPFLSRLWKALCG